MKDITVTIVQVMLDKKDFKLYHLTLSNTQVLSIHEDIMIKHLLTKGTGLEIELVDDIINENQNYMAYLRGIRYLALKSRTSYQVAVYLKQQEFEQEHIDSAISQLSQEGYLNDEQYAIHFVMHSSKAKSKGINWIKQYLNQIGIPKSYISKALEHYDDEQDLTLAIELASKKWLSLKGENRVKLQKLGQFLMRKGFTGDIVRKTLQIVENKRLFDENTDIYS